MTVSNTTRRAGPYSCNGVQTAFTFAFKIFQASDMLVVHTDAASVETILVLGTDYSVTLNADQNANPGGTVTTTVAYATSHLVTLGSSIPLSQGLSLTNGGAYNATNINDALDKQTILTQQLAEQVNRAIVAPISGGATPGNLIATITASAAAASNSATAAAGSATSASSSATSAANSASAAASSATSASNSAAQAASFSPTGAIYHYFGATAPAGWLIRNGSTIGDASSGATSRANADTQALFTLIWNNSSNTDFPIQDSTGAASTRGASAATDFAAHKRMPLPDDRGSFDRGVNTSGAGVDNGRVLGSYQADAFQGHEHTYLAPTGSGTAASGGVGSTLQNTQGIVADASHGTPRIASETRPANRAYLPIIKL